MKIKGIAGSLLEWERRDAIAANPNMPICVGCGWPSDDPELELCCDCFAEIDFKCALRGKYGKVEQREARETLRIAEAW